MPPADYSVPNDSTWLTPCESIYDSELSLVTMDYHSKRNRSHSKELDVGANVWLPSNSKIVF